MFAVSSEHHPRGRGLLVWRKDSLSDLVIIRTGAQFTTEILVLFSLEMPTRENIYSVTEWILAPTLHSSEANFISLIISLADCLLQESFRWSSCFINCLSQ